VHVSLLIDYPPDAPYHRATIEALDHAAGALGAPLDLTVCRTDSGFALDGADGVIIGPGSPYRDETAVWAAIGTARERGIPLVGT